MSENERDYILFIEDVLESIRKIEKYTKDLKFKEFSQKEMTIDAVIRNFAIIWEAVGNIPLDVQEKYPDVEWKEAKGFRNILIHDYFGIDLEAVWDTINNDIPLLKEHIIKVLEQEKK